jgi:F-type H+-transporting ATPase subunit delta
VARRTPAANRYANAVFDVAREDGSFDLWLRELSEIERLLADPTAAQVLLNPVIPAGRKTAILAAALPTLSLPVGRFVGLLIDRGRLANLPQINERLRRQIDDERGVQGARVTTAVPLDPGERELIAARLSARFGKRIHLEEHVDPSVIGGVVAQVGDQIIDGSVRGRLERLRRTLAEGR